MYVIETSCDILTKEVFIAFIFSVQEKHIKYLYI